MIYICLFIIGIILGSFYNVVGLRRPLNESIIKPRSHCPKCNHVLSWYELIPLISYFIQKGKCRNCHKKIAKEYPLIELLTGLLFVLSYLIFGFSYNTLLMLIISSLLVIIFVSDFKYYVILDGPLLISGFLILIIKYLERGLNQFFIAILSGLFLFIVMILIKIIGNKIFKRESLGGGDIKLAFIIGLVLNYKLGLIALILSSFFALPYALIILYKKNIDEMPLGPFLVSSLLFVFIFSDVINNILEVFFF